MESNGKKKRIKIDAYIVTLVLVIFIAVIVCVINFFVVDLTIRSAEAEDLLQNQNEYKYHFVLIYEGNSNEYWDSVYESANAYLNENNAYLEVIGTNLPENYSKNELMEIAVLSGVDGIIVEGDDSRELEEGIKFAEENNIPVVTAMTDSSKSGRVCFVGTSGYDLGQSFGQQVLNIATGGRKKVDNVMVFMSSGAAYTSQHAIYLSMLEKISKQSDIKFDVRQFDDNTEFSTDEEIRDILIDMDYTDPDVIVCLSEDITKSAYQSVVEYNKVGKIDIIGFSSLSDVYSAVDKEIVKSIVSIDSKTMGEKCGEALLEYVETGNVSEYVMVDTTVISKDNVEEFVKDESE